MDSLNTKTIQSLDYSPDTVRSRARATLLLAVQRIDDKLSSDDAATLSMSELNGAVGALGKVAGLATEGDGGKVTVTVVRVDAPARDGAPRPLIDAQLVDAHQLGAGEDTITE